MTVREFKDECKRRLSPLYQIGEISSLASRALEDIYGISHTRQLTYPEEEISPTGSFQKDSSSNISSADKPCVAVSLKSKCAAPEEVISRLENGEPVQYIAGFEYFCGEKFKVGPGVLIPRPETEELVNLIAEETTSSWKENQQARSSASPFKIFDVCTGSGCIAWSLHKLLSGHSSNKESEDCDSLCRSLESYGCDISETALKYAKNQRYLYGHRWPMFFRYDVLNGDFTALKSFIGKLDIIVSNPPYIAEKEKALMHKNVLDFEPAEALFVSDGDPLLFYRKIAGMAQELLYPGGKLYFEINPLFAEELKALLQQKNYRGICVTKDIAGRNRFISATR